MHITVVPAGAKTTQAAIRALLAHTSKPTVKGVYRDLLKVPSEFKSNPQFEAVQGNLEDTSSLKFDGSDAVLTVLPPIYEDVDTVQLTKTTAENVKAAIRKSSSVKRLVHVSSIGAQYDHDVGEILTNHASEAVLKDAAPEVVFIRCSYFMENWASALGTIHEASFFFSTVTPLDFQVPQVATQDVGIACATELLKTGDSLKSSPYVFDLHGPRTYSTLEVQKAFQEASGKDIEVRPVEKEGILEYYSSVFPPGVAKSHTELNLSFLPGGIIDVDPQPTGEVRHGETELLDVIRVILGWKV